MKSYQLDLPVFKKGDDLAHHIHESNGNLKEAFLNQALSYEEAAKMCRRMAGVVAEMPELDVQADTHIIAVDYVPADGSKSSERLEMLVKEGLLTSWEGPDDEDDEDDDEDSDEDDDEDSDDDDSDE